jgi:uncharacterized phage protein gp47/JayE
MAVQQPTLNDLYVSILSDLKSELGITSDFFGKVFLMPLAMVQAGKLKLYYLAIANLQRNIFVDLAEPISFGGTLERFGLVKLNRLPFTAQSGSYDVTVTGTIGVLIPANTTFKSNDDSLSPSKLYVLDADYTMITESDVITVRATEGGLDSRLVVADKMSLTAPIANLDTIATVVAETIIPLSAEDIEDYRAKVIEAYQLEPQGGAGSDYRIWSSDAQGVLRVYPYARFGFPNEVVVFVEATIADSSDGKGTPTQAILDDVADVIEFDPDTTKPLNERGRRPLGVFDVVVSSITLLEIDLEFTGFLNLTAEKQTSILNAVIDFLSKTRPFVASSDVLANKNDIISVNNLTFIVLEAEPTAVFTSLDLKVDSVSVPSLTLLDGNIPTLNTITYV